MALSPIRFGRLQARFPVGTPRQLAAALGDVLEELAKDFGTVQQPASGSGLRLASDKALEVAVSPEDFLAVGNGSTDDLAAWQAAIDYVAGLGGGVVRAARGGTYAMTAGPIVKEGVLVDLNRATITFKFASGADVFGFDMRSWTMLTNGTIAVAALGNPTSSSAFLHANVIVGAVDGTLVGYEGWAISDLSLTNNRSDSVGSAGVGVYAASHRGRIENLTFPSSSTLACGVRIHWAGDGGSPSPSASAHPHNISVRNLTFGTMSRAATSDVAAVDLVGVYNVRVDGVEVDAWAGDAIVQVRPGGFGSTAASTAVQKAFLRGIEVSNVVGWATKVSAINLNGYAVGGGAISAANYPIYADIRNVRSVGLAASGAASNAGIRITKTSGAVLSNIECEQHILGIYVEEATSYIRIRDSRFHNNQQSGVFVGNSTTGPHDIHFERVDSYLNGQDGTNQSGFHIEACSRIFVRDCVAGDATSETAQYYGFRVAASTATETYFSGRNQVRNVKSGGTRYAFVGDVIGDLTFGGGSNGALSTTTTEYGPLSGTGLSTTEADSTILVGADMVLTNFQVKLSAAPTGATVSRGIRIRDDGATTALEVTLVDTATTGTDFDAVEVAAGSELNVQSLVTNSPAAAHAKWSVQGFLT